MSDEDEETYPIPSEEQMRELARIPSAAERFEIWMGSIQTYGTGVTPEFLRTQADMILFLREDGPEVRRIVAALREVVAREVIPERKAYFANQIAIYAAIRDGKQSAPLTAIRREHPEVEAEIMRFLKRGEIAGA